MNWERKWELQQALRERLRVMTYDDLCGTSTRALKKDFDLSGHTIGAMIRDEMRGRS